MNKKYLIFVIVILLVFGLCIIIDINNYNGPKQDDIVLTVSNSTDTLYDLNDYKVAKEHAQYIIIAKVFEPYYAGRRNKVTGECSMGYSNGEAKTILNIKNIVKENFTYKITGGIIPYNIWFDCVDSPEKVKEANKNLNISNSSKVRVQSLIDGKLIPNKEYLLFLTKSDLNTEDEYSIIQFFELKIINENYYFFDIKTNDYISIDGL